MIKLISKLGPGLLFAGAAIGVSHLVQSTRAGADFGWGLIWALILVNIFKYPFFQYGPRYAMATGESLLDGYYKVGKVFLVTYFILNIATMFTIQTAVTIVTAGLASSLFGLTDNMVVWSLIITVGCYLILLFGKYQLLDKMIKIIILILAVSTIFSTGVASFNSSHVLNLEQVFPTGTGLVFLVAFMGWMPAPLDISIWHSIWAIEKNKNEKITQKEQVAKMLKSILNIKELPKNLDSTDGLAAAVCHYFNFDSENEKKKYSNWSSFINKNPDKIA